MVKKVHLTLAIADYPHTAALLDGSIEIAGVEAKFLRVTPQIAAFRRMVRQVEFDVCELAPTTYIIARAYGAPFVALPIFVFRKFHHGGLLVRPDSGIKRPGDLEGKRVGVRAYSVTTGVWTRSVLIDEFGVDVNKVTWVVDDEEHVTQMKLPDNVIHAPQGVSLVDLITRGELAAGFDGNAGIGRAGAPTGAWAQVESQGYPDLFPDAQELEAEWFKRTGVYPMHGTIVVKDSVLAENPWIARSLYDAFEAAKQHWLKRLASGEANTALDNRYRALSKIVGADPLPYGMAPNMPTIRALEDTAFKQKLVPRRMGVDELFVDPLTV